MKKVFVDAVYLVALNLPDDQWYEDARDVTRQLGRVRLVTSQEVLSEFLALMGRAGRETRAAAVQTVREVLSDPDGSSPGGRARFGRYLFARMGVTGLSAQRASVYIVTSLAG